MFTWSSMIGLDWGVGLGTQNSRRDLMVQVETEYKEEFGHTELCKRYWADGQERDFVAHHNFLAQKYRKKMIDENTENLLWN